MLHRVVALSLTLALLVGFTPWEAGGGSITPLVMVPEMGSDAEEAFGYPSGERGSLMSRLLSRGYREEDMAALNLAGKGSDFIALSAQLADLILETLQKTGARQLDVVAYGSGSLVARALILHPQVRDGVRQIIMVSPPNQGQNWVRSWGREDLLHRLESRRRQEGRFRREGPPIWEASPRENLVDYIYWRAHDLYEALYADYLWSERLVLTPPRSPRKTFEAWLKSSYPGEFARLVSGDRSTEDPLSSDGIDRYLAPAYAEILSVKAGRHLYQRLTPATQALVEDWEKDIVPAETWQETLLRFALARGARFLVQVGWPWLSHQLRGPLLEGLKSAAGWNDLQPWPALIPPSVDWPPGGQATVSLVANSGLSAISTIRSRQEVLGPRHVLILEGRNTPEPLRVFPGQARGEECLMYLGPGDEVWALPGVRGFGLRSPSVQAQIASLLEGSPATEVSGQWTGSVTTLRPIYLDWRDQSAHVAVTGSVPPGYRLAMWRAESPDGLPPQVFFTDGEASLVKGSGFLGLQLIKRAVRPPSWDHLMSPPQVEVLVKPTQSQAADDEEASEPHQHIREQVSSGDIPLITAIRTSRMTTTKGERRIYHQRWEWSWEGGNTWSDPSEGVTVSRLELPAGTSQEVTARSYANDGRLLREIHWRLESGQEDLPEGVELSQGGSSWVFTAHSIEEPVVSLSLEGPRSWVTGREAVYRVTADIEPPPYAGDIQVHYYPGQEFRVLWERPGTFTVRAAVNLRFSYRLPERSLYVSVIFVHEEEVEVMATSVSR